VVYSYLTTAIFNNDLLIFYHKEAIHQRKVLDYTLDDNYMPTT